MHHETKAKRNVLAASWGFEVALFWHELASTLITQALHGFAANEYVMVWDMSRFICAAHAHLARCCGSCLGRGFE